MTGCADISYSWVHHKEPANSIMEDIIVSREHICSSYISMPKVLPDYYVVNKASSDSLINQRCYVKRIIFTDVKDNCYWLCDVDDTNYAFKLRVYKK